MIASFTTSRGSIYNIVNEGKTRRWKLVNNEGNQEESDITLYIDGADAYSFGVMLNFGAWASFDGDNLLFVVKGKTEKVMEYSKTPSRGLHPLELWGSLKDPDTLHVGNAITELW